jgi:large conductance mechanosensitive channel
VNFDNLYINLSGEKYASLAEAQEAGAPLITYGVFLNTVISFLVTAIAIFMIVELATWVRERPEMWRRRTAPLEESEAPTEKQCPFCLTKIPIAAVRCPNCTSRLEETPET